MENLTCTHGRKGQSHCGLDNYMFYKKIEVSESGKRRKGWVEGQAERVELYATQYGNKEDIYTGSPLTGEDLEDWNTSAQRSKLGVHLSNYQKEKAGK